MSADLLPPSANPHERAISNTIARISNVSTTIKEVWNPQTCPSDILPWLAWSLRVDNWDPTLPDDQKRALIASSIEIHRLKGTIGALKRALQALGYEVDVNDATGVAYTFRLLVNGSTQSVSSSTYTQLTDAVNQTKNARSHLTGIDVELNSSDMLYAAGVAISGIDDSIDPPVTRSLENDGILLGGGSFTYGIGVS